MLDCKVSDIGFKSWLCFPTQLPSLCMTKRGQRRGCLRLCRQNRRSSLNKEAGGGGCPGAGSVTTLSCQLLWDWKGQAAVLQQGARWLQPPSTSPVRVRGGDQPGQAKTGQASPAPHSTPEPTPRLLVSGSSLQLPLPRLSSPLRRAPSCLFKLI